MVLPDPGMNAEVLFLMLPLPFLMGISSVEICHSHCLASPLEIHASFCCLVPYVWSTSSALGKLLFQPS